jgi:hypothetical protein
MNAMTQLNVPGFNPVNTGGGCMALHTPLISVGYLLLTEDEGGIPTSYEDAWIGAYDDEGSCLFGDDSPMACVKVENEFDVRVYMGKAEIWTYIKDADDRDQPDAIIPESVSSFSELHDYIDANCLCGFCEDAVFAAFIERFGGRDEHEGMPEGMLDFVSNVQNALDAWLRDPNGLRALVAFGS